ncbi:hypothetical protein LTR37_013466 [Vermiconidia calcicola]|uniref:Uncharacterized protein n=1 Tax=Vermiconidia calcicola TaxID=1690605 RepID=A0ACC3MZ92_9PEZI|nr:hypothetical protein LTR37_013466 [Vermiconidia calcicola]
MPSTGRLYHPLALDAVEDIEEYRPGGYHPVHLADTYHERYKILHKLGSGGFSTTWLTRDTVGERYAALKILKAEETEACSELSVLERITELRTDHPGQKHVRTLIDQFSIRGPNGCHICLVTDVAGPSLHDLYNIVGAGFIAGARRLRTENARSVIKQVVDAVDFLHSNKICHGDLTISNVLLKLESMDSWTEEEVYQRLGTPNKVVLTTASGSEPSKSGPQYIVENANMPDATCLTNDILLVDRGESFFFENLPKPENVGVPYMYRAPETVFDSVYTPSWEAWSLACLLFEIRAGNPLFTSIMGSKDEIIQQMVQMKGKLPEPWWSAWDRRSKLFDEDGKPLKEWPNGRVMAQEYPLEEMIADIGSEDEEAAISGPCAPMLEPSWTKVPHDEAESMRDLMDGILQWMPEERMSVGRIRQHRWITGQPIEDCAQPEGSPV